MKKELSYCLTLLLICSTIFAQTELRFKYRVTDFKKPITADIYLINPENHKIQLFQDTLRVYQTNNKDCLSLKGNYKIICNSLINDLADSIEYTFYNSGESTEIEIEIDLGQEVKEKWINNVYTEVDRKNKGYLSVVEYNKAPKSIFLTLDNKESDDYYKGPFFKLHNNSRDTIYGEYLSGYFWGTLQISTDSINWSRKLTGQIDYEFTTQLPLAPDSNRIASVGSFGLFRKLPKAYYKYELLYSTKYGNCHGYSLRDEKKSINWWAKTEKFHRLKYDFKIE